MPNISVLGMVLILHFCGVLVALGLIAFGLISIEIIKESHVDKWRWSDSSHPKTLEMLRKHKEMGMFDLRGESCVEIEKEKNSD